MSVLFSTVVEKYTIVGGTLEKSDVALLCTFIMSCTSGPHITCFPFVIEKCTIREKEPSQQIDLLELDKLQTKSGFSPSVLSRCIVPQSTESDFGF